MNKQVLNIAKLTLIGAISILTACSSGTESVQASDSSDLSALSNYEKFVGGPQIKFSAEEHNFGTVKKGKKLKHSFYFVNSGDAPLVISNSKGSCGCTIPFFPKDPIQPGEKGQIDVEIDANNKESDKVFEVSVKVESNAENNLVKLKLSGIPQE